MILGARRADLGISDTAAPLGFSAQKPSHRERSQKEIKYQGDFRENPLQGTTWTLWLNIKAQQEVATCTHTENTLSSVSSTRRLSFATMGHD